MSRKLFACHGGNINLFSSVLVSREDGGNLWVIPPREVWEMVHEYMGFGCYRP